MRVDHTQEVAGSSPAATTSNCKDLQRSIDEKAPNSSDSGADSVSGSPLDNSKHTSDLQTVIDTWPDLLEAVKAGILAMVQASKENKA